MTDRAIPDVPDAGRMTLQAEVDRSRRSGEPFVLAYVDVDGHGAIIERDGLEAGALHLEALVTTLRASLRSYDAIVRAGEQLFLCGVANIELAPARRRATDICAAVVRRPGAGRIDIGLAELGPTDSLDDVIARAGADCEDHRPETLPA